MARSALTLRDDHDREVDAIITDAVVRIALRRGLMLRKDFPADYVARALAGGGEGPKGCYHNDEM